MRKSPPVSGDRKERLSAVNERLKRANLSEIGKSTSIGVFLFYLCVVMVIYGAASARYRFFPGKELNSFFATFDDVKKLAGLHWQYGIEQLHPNEITWPDGYPPHARVDASIDAGALTLVQAYRGKDYGLFLVDSKGDIVHEWRIDADLKSDLARASDLLMPGVFMVIDGAHLDSNGDVTFTVDYYGVAKIDRCSQKIWTLPGEYHHSLSVDENGEIWVPFRRYQAAENPQAPWISAPYYDESVARIGPDGVLMETFSLVDAAISGGYEGLLSQGSPDNAATITSDITHLNDADIVSAQFAAANPPLRAGDLMVSMRTLDAVAFIDRETRKFKFALSGLTLRQHDPDMLNSGGVLVYDNRTEFSQHNRLTYLPNGQGLGGSRIVEINPRTQEVVWSWEGTKARPFFSSIQGKIEPQPNGNILVAEPEGGRAFEIDRATGEIVWQFANLLEMRNGKPVYGRVTGATRHMRADLPFLEEGACAPSTSATNSH